MSVAPQRARRVLGGGSMGPSVDRLGAPVIDPTENVLALVEAAVRRQDDLRVQESQHVREIMGLRAQFDTEYRNQESNRVNAIRAVDVAAVVRAAEVANLQATTLATQVATAAEATRGAMVTMANNFNTALASSIAPLQEAINDLRRTQYEQQGQKQQKTEGREVNQWAIGIMLAGAGLVMVIVQVVLHYALNGMGK